MSEKVNMREVALDTLLDIEQSHKLSHVVMEDTLMRHQFLPKADRAFYTRLCEGVLEQMIYLDYQLNHLSKTPMRKCKPLIRNLLRLSAYQILFMKVPDSAACNEAVGLAKKRGFKGLSGFVNGVLRSLARTKDALPMPDEKKQRVAYLSVRYSMPEWIVTLLIDQYGLEATKQILPAFLQAKPVSVRANCSKTSPEKLKEQLEAEGISVEDGHYLPYAFSLSGLNYLGKLRPFREGLFAVQDESSMLPVHLSGIKEGDHVLDVCAAPGGKSFHSADLVGKSGLVISRDLTEQKVELIEDNQERMGYPQLRPQQWDATEFDPSLEGEMDVVIADLPCSGLGIMGRKNDIKYNINQTQLEELVDLQREILSVVWRYVKPGGTLMYSTCTLNKKENEEMVTWIAENLPFETVSIEEALPEKLQGRSGKLGYLQLIPGIDACDGFFVAKLKRKMEKTYGGME